MATLRRRASYNYGLEAGGKLEHGQPDTLYPPEGYCLLEVDLHRATTPLQVGSFPFLSQLNLRSVINLSAEPLHDKAIDFFRSIDVTMLTPRSLEAFDGPHDLWEEAAKESLELLLDADNQPMMLLDSPTEHEAACLVGCLRRLQRWSICAIHDEYRMLTMTSANYDNNQRFIERFDLDLVTLKGNNLPLWFREHLSMLEDEREAEEVLAKRDPQRCRQAWTRGFSSVGENFPATAPAPSSENTAVTSSIISDMDDPAPKGQSAASQGLNSAEREGSSSGEAESGVGGDVSEEAALRNMSVAGDWEESAGHGGETGTLARRSVDGRQSVPDYRLNTFVYVCPLVSEGCKFTAKAWLQDEDDG